jgi:hypothetical protein
MTPRLARGDRLKGAWWPYSDDITLELGPLLTALTSRVGPARGVMLSRSQWASSPLSWSPANNSRLRVSWYGPHEPDIAIVITMGGKRVDLLLIPSSASSEQADLAMNLASREGNALTGTDTLIAAGVRPAAELLAN